MLVLASAHVKQLEWKEKTSDGFTDFLVDRQYSLVSSTDLVIISSVILPFFLATKLYRN
jgi:hypothetical protein